MSSGIGGVWLSYQRFTALPTTSPQRVGEFVAGDLQFRRDVRPCGRPGRRRATVGADFLDRNQVHVQIALPELVRLQPVLRAPERVGADLAADDSARRCRCRVWRRGRRASDRSGRGLGRPFGRNEAGEALRAVGGVRLLAGELLFHLEQRVELGRWSVNSGAVSAVPLDGSLRGRSARRTQRLAGIAHHRLADRAVVLRPVEPGHIPDAGIVHRRGAADVVLGLVEIDREDLVADPVQRVEPPVSFRRRRRRLALPSSLLSMPTRFSTASSCARSAARAASLFASDPAAGARID